MAALEAAYPSISTALRCPACRSPLVRNNDSLGCTSTACGKTFPEVGGIPILINEANSVFRIGEIAALGIREASARSFWDRALPRLTANPVSETNYRRLAETLNPGGSGARVLVIGGARGGVGMNPLYASPYLELIETDVVASTNTRYVCDGHDLPFEKETFDAVVLQAVLEHVIDPGRVVAEAHRVLRPSGLVYAETPFMQQVHAAAFDFTRFTDLGHRRLFRYFEEIERGVACGPASALAWSFQHFLIAFSSGPRSRKLLTAFARLSVFWLKYFDYWLVRRKVAHDGASSVYFFGRKHSRAIDDRRLLELYRGAPAS